MRCEKGENLIQFWEAIGSEKHANYRGFVVSFEALEFTPFLPPDCEYWMEADIRKMALATLMGESEILTAAIVAC